MKISELTTEIICDHLHEVVDNLSDEDKTLLNAIKTASIKYCTGYTGKTAEELDELEEMTIAVLVLIHDMWDNRLMEIDKTAPNKVVDTILSMHSVNLIPQEA